MSNGTGKGVELDTKVSTNWIKGQDGVHKSITFEGSINDNFDKNTKKIGMVNTDFFPEFADPVTYFLAFLPSSFMGKVANWTNDYKRQNKQECKINN